MAKDSESSISSSSYSESDTTGPEVTELSTSCTSIDESVQSSNSTSNPKTLTSYYDYTAKTAPSFIQGSMNLVDIFLQKRNRNSIGKCPFGYEDERGNERARAGGEKEKCVINNECTLKKSHECLCQGGDSKCGIKSFSSVSFDVVESEDTEKSKTETSCESLMIETKRTKYYRIIQEPHEKRDCDNETCGICLERLRRKMKAKKNTKSNYGCHPNVLPNITRTDESKKVTDSSEYDCVYGILHDSKKGLGIGEGVQEEVIRSNICFCETECSKNKSYKKYEHENKKTRDDEKMNTDSGGTGDERIVRVNQKHCSKLTEVSHSSTTTEIESELDLEREDFSYSSESISGNPNKQKIQYEIGDFGRQSKNNVQYTVDSGTCSEEDSQYSRSEHTPSVFSAGSNYQISTPEISPIQSKSKNRQHIEMEFNTSRNDSKFGKKQRGKTVHFDLKSDITQSSDTKIIEAEFNLINDHEFESKSPQTFRSVSSLRMKLEIRESKDIKESQSNSENAIYSDDIEPDSLIEHFEDDTDIDESFSDIELACSCTSPLPLRNDEMNKYLSEPFHNFSTQKYTPMRLEIIKTSKPILKTVMEYMPTPYYTLLIDPCKSEAESFSIQSQSITGLLSKCASSDCCHFEIVLTDTDSSTISSQVAKSTAKKLHKVQSDIIRIDHVKSHELIFENELARGILIALMDEIYKTEERFENANDQYEIEIPFANIARAILKTDKEMNISFNNGDFPLIRLEITSDISEMLKHSLEVNHSDCYSNFSWTLTDEDDPQSSILLQTVDYSTKRFIIENESDSCILPLVVSTGSVETLKEIFPKNLPINNEAMKAIEVKIIPDKSVSFIKICGTKYKTSEDNSKLLIDKPPSLPPLFKNENWLKSLSSDFKVPVEVKHSTELISVESQKNISSIFNEIIPDLTELDQKSHCSNKNCIVTETHNDYITINSDKLTLYITYQELLSILTNKLLKEKLNGTISDKKLHDDQKVTFTNSDIEMIIDMANNRRRTIVPSNCQIEYKSIDSDGLTLDITYPELLSILTKQETNKLINLQVDQAESRNESTSSIANEDSSFQKILPSLQKEIQEEKFPSSATFESEAQNSEKFVNDDETQKNPKNNLQEMSDIKQQTFNQADLKSLTDHAKSNKRWESTDCIHDYLQESLNYKELLTKLITQGMEEKDKLKPLKNVLEVERKNENFEGETKYIESDTKLSINSIEMEDKSFDILISEEDLLSILLKSKEETVHKNSVTEGFGCDFDIISVNSETTSYDFSEPIQKKQSPENIKVVSSKVGNKLSTKSIKDSGKHEEFKSKIPVKLTCGVDLKHENSILSTTKKILEGSETPVETKPYRKEKIETLIRKSKIPKTKSLAEKLKITSIRKDELNNAKIKTENAANKIAFEMSPEMPSNEELLSIALRYKKVTSDDNKIGTKKGRPGNPLNVCPECEIEIRSVDYDCGSCDEKLPCIIKTKDSTKIVSCKNIQSASLNDCVESISVKSDQQFLEDGTENISIKNNSESCKLKDENGVFNSGSCNSCREKSLTNRKEKMPEDVSLSYNECQEKWLSLSNNIEKQPGDLPSNSESCNICREKWLSLSNSKEEKLDKIVSDLELCNICRETWLSLSNSKEQKPEDLASDLESSTICREKWLSLWNSQAQKPEDYLVSDLESCNICRDKWLSLSNSQEQKPGYIFSNSQLCNICREKWLSLSNSKDQRTTDFVSYSETCACHEKWMSLSNSKKQKLENVVSDPQICNACLDKWPSLSNKNEKMLGDIVSDSGLCISCRKKWLSLANNRKQTLEDSYSELCNNPESSLENDRTQETEEKNETSVNSTQSSNPCCEERKEISRKSKVVENTSFDSNSESCCDISLMEWLNQLKEKKDDIVISKSKLSCQCCDESRSDSGEERLSSSKAKIEETSSTCCKECMSSSISKTETIDCTFRDKLPPLSEKASDSDGPDSLTCDECLEEWWLTEMEKNNTLEVKKSIENPIENTKARDQIQVALDLSNIDNDFGRAGVSDLMANDISGITDFVLDENQLSDIPDFKLYEDFNIPDITENDEDCKCSEKFEQMTKSSMISGRTDDECCSCIVDEYDEYFFSRTPWGSSLDQATVGILRAVSIFTDDESNTLRNSEQPPVTVTQHNETGITNSIKWGIDFLRTQLLGPTISESVITFFEGINYLTSAAYGVDSQYEINSCCPKRRNYYQNRSEQS